jgi:hypothetical protein
MHGHVRKRHKPTCAKRADKRKRCNCSGSWQARMPDLNGARSNTEISRTFGTEQEAKDLARPAARHAARRDVHRPTPRRAPVLGRPRRLARVLAGQTQPDDRAPLRVDHRQVPRAGVRASARRPGHARNGTAVHQPACGRYEHRARNGAQRLRRAADRDGEGSPHGRRLRQSLHRR